MRTPKPVPVSALDSEIKETIRHLEKLTLRRVPDWFIKAVAKMARALTALEAKRKA